MNSSEANTVDKLPFEIRGCPADVMLNLPNLRIIVYDEQNYVYVGKPVSSEEEWILRTTTFDLSKNLDDPFVHKKYFLVSLLMKNKKT